MPRATACGVPLVLPACRQGVWQWHCETSEDSSERFELVYDELLQVAEHCLRHERGRTLRLEPAELVHEAYLRLNTPNAVQIRYHNTKHFFALWSRTMRRILIDCARRAKSQKRGGDWQQVGLDQVDLACQVEPANP
jgi:hypothetical protein